MSVTGKQQAHSPLPPPQKKGVGGVNDLRLGLGFGIRFCISIMARVRVIVRVKFRDRVRVAFGPSNPHSFWRSALQASFLHEFSSASPVSSGFVLSKPIPSVFLSSEMRPNPSRFLSNNAYNTTLTLTQKLT